MMIFVMDTDVLDVYLKETVVPSDNKVVIYIIDENERKLV